MVEFGDYVMPVWYASAKDEHLAVVTHAGLFDTSHMAAVRVQGTGRLRAAPVVLHAEPRLLAWARTTRR